MGNSNKGAVDVKKKEIEYRETVKFNEWCKLVLDKSNKLTYANFTRSAIVAYGYDENDPKQYIVAKVQGHRNYVKMQEMAGIYFDRKNVSFGMLMDVLLAKMAKQTTLEAWNVVMDYMRYDRPNKNQGVQVPPSSNQFNFFINKDERGRIIEEADIAAVPEAQLADVLIEGGDPVWEEPAVEVHSS